MKLSPKELDKALKLLDPNIRVVRYGYPYSKYHGYTDALRYKGEHVGSIPHGRVYDKKIKEYGSDVGEGNIVSHRSINDILRMISQYLAPYKIKKFNQFVRMKDYSFLMEEDSA